MLRHTKVMNTFLVLGGARSGKSSYAQDAAESMRKRRVFIATAEAHDDEMRARAAQNQKRIHHLSMAQQ